MIRLDRGARRGAELAVPRDALSPTEPGEYYAFELVGLEVEEEGGFRRVPEVGYGNFLWASDFPGLDSPWPHSKAMGHAPCEAALGRAALDQLVFDNAQNLYKIPVALPQRQAAK